MLSPAEVALGLFGQADRFRGLPLVIEVELRELRDHLEQIDSQAGLRLTHFICASDAKEILVPPDLELHISARAEYHLHVFGLLTSSAASGFRPRRFSPPNLKALARSRSLPCRSEDFQARPGSSSSGPRPSCSGTARRCAAYALLAYRLLRPCRA
jgi:hypothetical protein